MFKKLATVAAAAALLFAAAAPANAAVLPVTSSVTSFTSGTATPAFNLSTTGTPSSNYTTVNVTFTGATLPSGCTTTFTTNAACGVGGISIGGTPIVASNFEAKRAFGDTLQIASNFGQWNGAYSIDLLAGAFNVTAVSSTTSRIIYVTVPQTSDTGPVSVQVTPANSAPPAPNFTPTISTTGSTNGPNTAPIIASFTQVSQVTTPSLSIGFIGGSTTLNCTNVASCPGLSVSVNGQAVQPASITAGQNGSFLMFSIVFANGYQLSPGDAVAVTFDTGTLDLAAAISWAVSISANGTVIDSSGIQSISFATPAPTLASTGANAAPIGIAGGLLGLGALAFALAAYRRRSAA